MKTFRHIGTQQIHLEATDSTNNRAAEFAHDPANAGLVISADVQTQGRGQHGRVWHSQPGTNVLLSVLLFPPEELRKPAVLTALASVAVAETVSELTRQEPSIKWPNDVLVAGKKIAGILIESGVKKPSTQYFVAGIGLNVNQTSADFQAHGLPDATSLHQLTDRSFEVALVTRLLVQKLDEGYELARNGQIAKLESQWTTRLGIQGHNVTVEFMNADESDGRLRSMSFEHLEIESTNGEVRWLRPEEVRHIRSKSV
ncbi:MAG: biotin--[acetyl-CoA-carboxylase] ligase [Gemmataceae bacterium]|nr:biotin--[acetyl-CoA-carboxylase] ligase [Gemmataceae bacterium]